MMWYDDCSVIRVLFCFTYFTLIDTLVSPPSPNIYWLLKGCYLEFRSFPIYNSLTLFPSILSSYLILPFLSPFVCFCFPCRSPEERVVPLEVSRSKLSRHLQGVVFRCHKCTFTCSSDESLQLHIHKHNEIKPYQCQLCYYDSKYKHALENHLRDEHKVSPKP